jgi:hypothetical protein
LQQAKAQAKVPDNYVSAPMWHRNGGATSGISCQSPVGHVSMSPTRNVTPIWYCSHYEQSFRQTKPSQQARQRSWHGSQRTLALVFLTLSLTENFKRCLRRNMWPESKISPNRSSSGAQQRRANSCSQELANAYCRQGLQRSCVPDTLLRRRSRVVLVH